MPRELPASLPLQKTLTLECKMLLFSILLCMPFADANALGPCLAANGCLENMTDSWWADGNHYPVEKRNRVEFLSLDEALNDLCVEIKEWEALANESACVNYSVTCPSDGIDITARSKGYDYPINSVQTCRNPEVKGTSYGVAMTTKHSRCKTPPHLYGEEGNIRDSVMEQCWACSASLRGQKRASFGRWAPSGEKVDSSYSHVTMFSPDACPTEREATDCEKSSKVVEGNPISCDSGAKIEVDTDYRAQGGDSLSFSRNYTSQPDISEAGFGWSSSHDVTFKLIQDESYSRVAEVGNSKFRYLYVGAGGATKLTSSTNAHGFISLVNGAWTWTTADGGKVVFGAGGKAVQKQSKGGVVNHYVWQEIVGVGYVLESITSETGRQLHFTHNALGQMQTLTDPAGNVTSYEYDANGNLVKVVYPDDTPATLADNPFKIYHYEDPRFIHALTGKTDENGDRHSTYAYDEHGKGILTTLANNANKVTLTYPEHGVTEVERHVSETDSHKLIYHISRFHGASKVTQLESQSCAGCAVTEEFYKYDFYGRLQKIIHKDSTETIIKQDNNFRETRRTEAVGTTDERVITRGWNTTWNTPSFINNNGKKTSYGYDAEGRLSVRVDAGAYTRYTYTAGNLTRIDGPLSSPADHTNFTYDAQRNMESRTNALGHFTLFSNYDANGRVGTIVDSNGLTTTYSYTPRGWLEAMSVNGRVTTFTYDKVGQLKLVQSPSGSVMGYEYDAAHRLIAITDGEGNRLEYTLDFRGNRKQEVIKNASDTVVKQKKQRFNALSQLVEVINGSNQSAIHYQYDIGGQIIEESSITGDGPRSTLQQYDALGRVSQTVDALNGVTTFDYNVHDALVRVEDTRGIVTDYSVNTRGEVTQLTSPDTGTTTYEYDAAGNRTAQVDARGVRTEYTYDALNRLTQVHYPSDPSLDVIYTYDQGTNGIGRLTRLDDATGYTTYTYDAWGNVISQTQVTDGNTYTVTYGYNLDNQLESITYPSGQVVTYSFDDVVNISGVSSTSGGATSSLASGIGYLPFGPAEQWTLGNGLIVSRDFDLDYRLTGVTTTPVIDYSYAYDPVGNIIAWDNLLDASRSQTFDYDVLDRLTDATGVYGDFDYSYDPVGNRLSKTKTAGSANSTDTYSYDPTSNRLAGITGGTTESIGYDAVGNIVSRGSDTFTYNVRNRMVQVNRNGSVVAQYQHNGKGERVIKTAGGITTHFVYDLMGNIIVEANGAG
ncbi:DUF6531 domain-containing protein, partial [Gilvimarinus agarilyticus]|uniref:DUF6531 domain-containing protein n=1 Tax=Gilvimarinus agarilyticus TaxID=679259 RepID=UPI0009FBD9B6